MEQKHRIIPENQWQAHCGKTPEQLETSRQEFDEDCTSIEEAILRQLSAGADIGELIYQALRGAQSRVAQGHSLLDNRPGSWTAASLEPLMGSVFTELEPDR